VYVRKCVCACIRRMLTVIASRRCVYVRMCVNMIKAYAHGHSCAAMHVCAYVCACIRHMLTVIASRQCVYVRMCVNMIKAYSHGHSCAAMHVCAYVCMNKAYAPGIPARQYMYVLS
jgi:hypothetical protein